MQCLGQVSDTPLVVCPELGDLTLTDIGKLENQPKYSVTIHSNIVVKCHWNTQGYSVQTKFRLATIHTPGILLKHHVKCIVH